MIVALPMIIYMILLIALPIGLCITLFRSSKKYDMEMKRLLDSMENDHKNFQRYKKTDLSNFIEMMG